MLSRRYSKWKNTCSVRVIFKRIYYIIPNIVFIYTFLLTLTYSHIFISFFRPPLVARLYLHSLQSRSSIQSLSVIVTTGSGGQLSTLPDLVLIFDLIDTNWDLIVFLSDLPRSIMIRGLNVALTTCKTHVATYMTLASLAPVRRCSLPLGRKK